MWDDKIKEMKTGGSVAKNDFIARFLADITGAKIIRPKDVETTSLGVAIMARLAVGIWSSLKEVQKAWSIDKIFEPSISSEVREALYAGWKKAVERALGWANPIPF